MRKALTVILVFLAVAAAPITAGSSPADVPFKASFSGNLLEFITIFDGPEAEALINARCNDPANLPPAKFAYAVARFEGWGNGTHLGRAYVQAEHCSYVAPDGQGGFEPDGTYGQGVMTFYSANGDMLSATYYNGISLSPLPVVEFIDIVEFNDSGSGRFSNASGFAIDIGTVDFRDSSTRVDIIGRISYGR